MKRICTFILISLLLSAASSAIFAGGAEENNNHSAEMMKTLNRNASTDSDATFYNPAGTAFMEEGAYIYLSSQTIYIPIEIRGHSLTRNVYKGEKVSYCTPNLHVVYNKENIGTGSGDLAWSFALMPIGGGGFGEYEKGLPYIDNALTLLSPMVDNLYALLGIPYTLQGTIITSQFEGSSAFYSAMTNIAYSFVDDRLALSLGYRFIYGQAIYDAKLYSNGIIIPLGGRFHARQDGVSHGIIFGISAEPIEAITIGLKFEYHTPFRLKTKASGDHIVGMVDSSFRDGGEAHRQLPMNINIGIAYRIKGFQLSWSYTHYLNQLAQWKGKEKNFRDGYEAGMGLDYTFNGVPLNIGCGYLYTRGGARNSGQSQLAELPDGHTVSTGFTYTFIEKIKFTCAFAYIYYMPVDINKGTMLRPLPAKFIKQGYDLALGVECKVK